MYGCRTALVCFFFFKQKTAYEMRISDWSSDVCSSDLLVGNPKASRAVGGANGANNIAVLIPCHRVIQADGTLGGYAYGTQIKSELLRREATDRKSVV